jgi:predicted ATPase/class 3 adenylate cyclase
MPAVDGPTPQDLKALLSGVDPAVLAQVMPLTGGVITMMFTDIVDSTAIKADVGDEPFFEALKQHHGVVRTCVEKHNGRELKTIGDAFFVGFALPAGAVECSQEIQERLAQNPIRVGTAFLEVRIGLHIGTPIVYRDPVSALIDLSGTDVDKAARVEALARGGQILISEETRTLARPRALHDWGAWELKGLGRHRVFEVLWPGKNPERPAGRSWLAPVRFLTRFIGRDEEIDRVMDAVLGHRLVTLRGMGGIGKTRVADEVAARLAQEFDDGVVFVDLTRTADSEAALVADLAARLNTATDDEVILAKTLSNRRILLVLDNFEAVIGTAPLVSRLLRQCAGVHLLVTSQRLMGVDAEQQIEVGPMLAPKADSALTIASLSRLDSYSLFQDRARLQRLDWQPTEAEAGLLAEIIELTDGIPLCIELAAAWVGRVSLRSLRDGLTKNRDEFLARTGSALEERRHASIRSCIDWSCGLLESDEQTLFFRLAVFAGAFRPEDVEAVCEVTPAFSHLESLRGCSLLEVEGAADGTWYRMLPTIRVYALSRLGADAVRLRRRHAEYFLAALGKADDQIRAGDQRMAIARITALLDEIRAGMDSALAAHAHAIVVRYSETLGSFLRLTGRFTDLVLRSAEGLVAAQALNDARSIAGSQNNLGNAYGNLPTGDRGANLTKAMRCYEAALRVFTERDFPRDWAMTQNNLGNVYGNLPTGDRAVNLTKAIGCSEAALRVFTEHEFPIDWAMTQNNLGIAYGNLPTGDRAPNLTKAIGCSEAALRVFTEHEFPLDWAMTQNNLGSTYRNLPTGDRAANLTKAIGCYEAALRVRTERDFPLDWAMTQGNLGCSYAQLPTGDRGANVTKAIGCYEAALRVRTERDFPRQWAVTQNNLGIAFRDLPTGDRGANLTKARRCFEAALRGFTASGLREEAEGIRARIRGLDS